LLALLIKEVAQPFQKEQAEDVFLEFRRIHVPAQVVARAEQETGELAEGELSHVGKESIKDNEPPQNTPFPLRKHPAL